MSNAHKRQVGPFLLGTALGRGGMGAVFRATNVETGTPVAIKFLSTGLAGDGNFRLRFQHEIEALRQLNHPNIVRFYGYGQDEDLFYYAMELVDGCSLEEELRRGRRFSWEEALRIGVQVAAALRCAHDHGIIHRDLKPGNLLLTPAQGVKLLDFGIATLFGANKVTEAGNIVGTIAFMAPEQAALQPVTVRSDLYSLGAVLVALMSGSPPFDGKNLIEILHQQTSRPAKRPSQLGIEIPTEFDELIGRLLDRDPTRRPKGAFTVLRQMSAILSECQSENSNPDASEVIPLDESALRERLGQLAAENQSEENSAFETQDFAPDCPPRVESATWFQSFDGREPDPALPPDSVLDGTPPDVTSPLDHEPARTFFHAENATENETETTRRSRFWDSSWAVLMIILVGTGVLASVASYVIRHWSTPPPADVLFERIVTAEDSGGTGTARYERDLDLFLNYYSRDHRCGQVIELQNTLKLERLEKRLRMNTRNQQQLKRSMLPVERDYLNATRFLTTQPETALADLESFVMFYKAARPVADDSRTDELNRIDMYLDIANQQLLSLRRIVQNESEARARLVETARKRVEMLLTSDAPEDHEEAETLRRAIEKISREPNARQYESALSTENGD